jgi:hypothetical protein
LYQEKERLGLTQQKREIEKLNIEKARLENTIDKI